MVNTVLDQVFEHLARGMRAALMQLDNPIDCSLISRGTRLFHRRPVRFRLANEAAETGIDIHHMFRLARVAITSQVRINFVAFVVKCHAVVMIKAKVRRLVSLLGRNVLAIRGGIDVRWRSLRLRDFCIGVDMVLVIVRATGRHRSWLHVAEISARWRSR